MDIKIKKALSAFTAMCFTLATLSFTNHININAKEIEKHHYLSRIEINASYVNRYCDWDKYNRTFYDQIIAEYDSSYDSEESSLKILNKAELAALAKAVNDGKNFENKYIKLENDIDLQGTVPQITETEDSVNSDESSKFKITISGELENVWYPIGDSDAHPFKGNFDGNNHEIKNMVALNNSSGKSYFGFFGYTSGGEIKNIGISENSYVVSSLSDRDGNCAYAGILVAYSDSSIINSYVTGNVYANSNYEAYTGDMVGGSSISNNYTTGNVYDSDSYTNYAGGLVAYSNSSISNSYAIGNVYASAEGVIAGSLVGESGSNSIISNSYATGNVYVNANVASSAGGLAGSNYGSIRNSYRNSEAIIEAKKKDGSVGTISQSGTPLTVREMTGAGEGRAEEKMVGFKNAADGNENKIWIFTADSNWIEDPKGTYTQTLYYPRLSSINYESGNEPKTTMVTFDIDKCINVEIIGELYENEMLEAKATAKDSSINIDNLKYQWYVAGKVVYGETGSKYTLKNEDLEENIQVKITADGYLGEVTSSIQRKKSALSVKDEATKVWILANYGVFPYGSKLVVKDMNEGENYNTVVSILDKSQKDIVERIKFYDISILDRDGNPSKPNGKVTVRLPIPDDFDKDDLEALKVTDGNDIECENEKVIDIDGVYYLEFETDHFSYYALMDKNMLNNIETGDSNNTEYPSNTGIGDLIEIENSGNIVETSDHSLIIFILFSLLVIASCLVIIKQRKNLRIANN